MNAKSSTIKKINIQFFATLQENIHFLKEAVKNNFHAILFVNGYTKSIIIDSGNINHIEELLFQGNKDFWQAQIVFSCKNFIFTNDYNDFYKKNSNILFFTLGEQNENIMKESWLASSVFLDEVGTFLEFSAFAKFIKKNTMCGATIFHGDVAKKNNKTIRFTKGAYEFNKNGGLVYQVNEKVHFMLGNVSE